MGIKVNGQLMTRATVHGGTEPTGGLHTSGEEPRGLGLCLCLTPRALSSVFVVSAPSSHAGEGTLLWECWQVLALVWGPSWGHIGLEVSWGSTRGFVSSSGIPRGSSRVLPGLWGLGEVILALFS